MNLQSFHWPTVVLVLVVVLAILGVYHLAHRH